MIRDLWRALLPLAVLAATPVAAIGQQLVAQSQYGKTKVEIHGLKREDGDMLMLALQADQHQREKLCRFGRR